MVPQTYANQIKQIEVQYKRLVSAGQSLASDPMVGSRAVFAQELKDLEMQWGPLRDNVMDTLELLIRYIALTQPLGPSPGPTPIIIALAPSVPFLSTYSTVLSTPLLSTPLL